MDMSIAKRFPSVLPHHELPSLYRRFSEIVGAGAWNRVARDRLNAIKGNPFLKDYYDRESSVPLQLKKLSEWLEQHRVAPSSVDQLRPFYSACSFMVQSMHLLESWPKRDTARLCRRIHSAMNKPEEMRGLRLELAVAGHFSRLGWEVQWPELLDLNSETFDLLVTAPTGCPLEVECKSMGEDKGRRISRLEAMEFLNLLRPKLKALEDGLSTGLAVTVTVPVRLPTDFKARNALATEIGKATLTSQGGVLSDGTDVRIDDFEMGDVGDNLLDRAPKELREVIDGMTATSNAQAMLMETKVGGALVLTIRSAKDDDPIKAMMDTLSDAARRQLTGLRAGMLVASLDGLTPQQLSELAYDDRSGAHAPSHLQQAAKRFLNSEERMHVVGLAFWSRSGVATLSENEADATGGAAYYFSQKQCRFWDQSFEGLFRAAMR